MKPSEPRFSSLAQVVTLLSSYLEEQAIGSASKRLRCLMVAGAILVIPAYSHGDVVTDWNVTMQMFVAPLNPLYQARAAAIVQLSVFEAVNATLGNYEQYLGTIVAPSGASPEAAAVAAAHRTLVSLVPGSVFDLDTMMGVSLASIPDGQEKTDGIAVGEAAAEAILQLRAYDGFNVSYPYAPGTSVGSWQPTPMAFTAAAFTGWGNITPFGMKTPWQFRSLSPPTLESRRYRVDYEEVKLVGRIDSPLRTQDRNDVARFYAVTLPIQLWSSIAGQASAAQGMTLSENARLFAILMMAVCDASIAVFESKYYYNLWRPVTAILAGGLDGNHATEPDSEWFSLVGTPPYPTYPSAHASLSGAARMVLERFFGKSGHSLTLANPALPTVVLNYTEFGQICDDIDDARIFGGIHFRFDQEAGFKQGEQVAKFIPSHYLKSIDE